MKTTSIRRVTLKDLKYDQRNPRSHSRQNLRHIEESLKRFGQVEPLVVQKGTGRVIGGNGRLAVMARLGWTDCNVVEVELDDLQASALAVALNRASEDGDWDLSALEAILSELEASQSLEGVGFSTEEFERLKGEVEALAGPAPEEAASEPTSDPRTKPGDLWELGEHRLLCGDSTEPGDVDRLLTIPPAAIYFDPPFEEEYDRWPLPTVPARVIALFGRQTSRIVFGAKLARSFPVLHEFVVTGNARQGQGLLCQMHDSVWLLCKGAMNPTVDPVPLVRSRVKLASNGRPHSVIQSIGGVVDLFHSKPVETALLLASLIDQGEIIYDPCCGSGTTIVAGEQSRRRVFAMESDPARCDGIVRRWEQAARKTASLEARADG
jgi:hypothetical protein